MIISGVSITYPCVFKQLLAPKNVICAVVHLIAVSCGGEPGCGRVGDLVCLSFPSRDKSIGLLQDDDTHTHSYRPYYR